MSCNVLWFEVGLFGSVGVTISDEANGETCCATVRFAK